MGATTQQAPQIQPVQRPVTQPVQTQPVAEQPVQMENGRIVYNRQYGNIPKGSYAGGSTYTVKKGDTLFYIAWITGNDFRDLAQRNSIPAPYSLNVGASSASWQRIRYANYWRKCDHPGGCSTARSCDPVCTKFHRCSCVSTYNYVF
ncbi:lipoprotein NlpD [Salmonella enterica subsp. arizonae]|uniref:Lipoprotein NlpD n=1 Tax=Salmonella enterica subsp. arizonae TaxID=59203 RepID=A0A379SRY5_SALER|nr:lipoprotein NlpD [Salmonella enterica subsp. arizonae]